VSTAHDAPALSLTVTAAAPTLAATASAVERGTDDGTVYREAFMVTAAAGVAALSDTGPADAAWIATGTAGVVALSDTGTAAAVLLREGGGTLAILHTL
jgi:hypothetical protein